MENAGFWVYTFVGSRQRITFSLYRTYDSLLSYGEVIFEITNFKYKNLVTPKEGEREKGICGELNQKMPG